MKKKTKVIFCLIMMLASCRDQGRVCSEEMDGNTFSNLRALFHNPAQCCSALCGKQDHIWEAGLPGMTEIRTTWYFTFYH